MNEKICPACDKAECFGCEDGACLVLIKNDFGYKECPFFKTREQVEKERQYCRNRMATIRKGE